MSKLPKQVHLTFDEGRGAAVRDACGNLPDAQVQYRYLNAAYTRPMEPQWRSRGVRGGCLLFDGSSTAVVYPPEAICLAGGALTISLWIAPRAFEWDDPETEGREDAHLTGLVGQYDPESRRGVLLGVHRFGRLCLRVGDGERFHTLWADSARLRRLVWNHVAAVFDGAAGRMALYQDGKPVGATDIPKGTGIAPAQGERLMIGKNAHAEVIPAAAFNMYAGLMDELYLDARALSPEEIAARASIEAPEVAYEDVALENILTGDVYKTQFHGGPYQHWMNEPHAPLYYNGLYHLFFQSNSFGPYWRGISWGHLVSEDAVRWRPVRDAIVPTEGSVVPDGIWTGGATRDVNGVPVLFFAAANYRFAREGLISNQNIGAAYPADLTDPELTDWVLCDELAIAQQPGQGRPGEFRDPHIWREGGVWYMVVCGGNERTSGGAALLYSTDVLEVEPQNRRIRMNWRYRGVAYEMENPSVKFGTSWELPVMLPLRNRAGDIERHAFFFLPAPVGVADVKIYYYVGDFDGESGRFTPDPTCGGLPRMLDYGDNVFTGPSVLVDPVTGRTCMFSIMQDQRDGREQGAAGWAHCVGLTREICLSDDGGDVRIRPDPRLYELLGEELVSLEDANLREANLALGGVSGDLLCVRAELIPSGGRFFGLSVKAGGAGDDTRFVYDQANQTILGTTNHPGRYAPGAQVEGPLKLADGALRMEVFIDRSLVEAFFNDDKAVTVRSYADPASQGIHLFADGELRVARLQVCCVRSIYE